MPKVHESKARTDRYMIGVFVPANTISGYKIDKSKPRDGNDKIFCKKGDIYYWWQFRTGGKHFSLEHPRPSMLAKSSFLKSIYKIKEGLEDLKPEDYIGGVLEDFKNELVEKIRVIRDDLKAKEGDIEKYGGMMHKPLLNQIKDRLIIVEKWQKNVFEVDVNYDEDEIEEAQEEAIGEEGFDDLTQGELGGIVAEKKEQKEIERIEEIINKLQDCSCDL